MQQFNNKFLSPSYDDRDASSLIKYVILHYTELNFDIALNHYLDPEIKLSTHYLVKQDGEILQLISDDKRAWHAGKSYWQSDEALNNSSLGIEIDNLGDEEFNSQQMQSVLELCQYLQTKHNILPQNFLAHSDIAAERKIDPGIFMNWRYLAEFKIGIMPDPMSQQDHSQIHAINDQSQEIMQLQQDLAKIGYDISANGIFDKKMSDVIRAFQLHYAPETIRQHDISYHKNLDNYFIWDQFSADCLNNLLRKLGK